MFVIRQELPEIFPASSGTAERILSARRKENLKDIAHHETNWSSVAVQVHTQFFGLEWETPSKSTSFSVILEVICVYALKSVRVLSTATWIILRSVQWNGCCGHGGGSDRDVAIFVQEAFGQSRKQTQIPPGTKPIHAGKNLGEAIFA